MAAANTDKLRKGARKWVGQIGAGGVADAVVTTIPLASSTGLPTDTAIDIVIDRVDSAGTATPSLEETATVVISGSNGTSAVRGVEGTAQAHDAGAVVEVLLTNAMWEDMVDAVVAEHNQDGTHGAITADTVTAQTTNGNLTIAGNGTGTVVRPTSVSVEVFGGTVPVATGDGKAYFTIPEELNGLDLKAVHARVVTAGTTGTTDIQIHNVTDGVDMLSTKLTIDSAETGSDTAAAAAVINTSNDDVVTNDLIRIDVDAVSTTAPKGLVVRLRFA